MRYLKFSILALIAISCTNPNEQFTSQIKEKLKKDANGIELNYKSISFNWVDTITNYDSVTSLITVQNVLKQQVLEKNIQKILGKEFIFSKEYVTVEKLKQWRNFEVEWGHPNKSLILNSEASWVKDGYKDYVEFALDNRDLSPFISELCTNINRIDSLITNYDDIDGFCPTLIKTSLWSLWREYTFMGYSKRDELKEIYMETEKIMKEINSLSKSIDELNQLGDEFVHFYIGENKYKINNPFINNAEQELTKKFKFDKTLIIQQ